MKYLLPICLLLLAACQQNEQPKPGKPTIEWDRTPVVRVGDTMNFEVRQGSGYAGRLPHDWAIEAGSLPPGVAIQYDGAKVHFVGTPTTPGVYTIKLRVKVGDTDPRRTRRDLTFIVPSLNGPLTIYTPDLPEGSENMGSYSTELVATGGTNSGYTWAVVAGTAPAGTYVGAWPTGGRLIVPMTKEGVYNFTLQITDDGGNTDTQDLELVLGPPSVSYPAGP